MGGLANDTEFQGDINTGIRQIAAPAGASGTLQTKAGDVWVDVPDGAIAGPTTITINAPANATYRVTAMAGGPMGLS